MLVTAVSSFPFAANAHDDDHNDAHTLDLGQLSLEQQPQLADIVLPAPIPELNLAIGGLWSDVVEWPLIAVHAALLPNGKVLAWDATPDDADDDPQTNDISTTRVTLWDPVAGTHLQTNNDTDTDLFCAGSAHLWDGRILFAGGDGAVSGLNSPLVNSNIYNPVTNTWHRTENMNAPRWYSAVAALSNGEMLTLGGGYAPDPLAEVFQFDQTWRPLSGTIEHSQPLSGDYQWIQQTPEGTVLYFGPSNVLVDIDTSGEGGFTPRATRDSVEIRYYGSYAMYDTGKILVAGGEQSLDTAVVIDTATRQTTDTSPLNFGRRQHILTILADGSVLATGGNSDGEQFYSPTAGILQPEIWNPETQLWTVQNSMSISRQYHSIALLLPDGKVLSAGGGLCGGCGALGYDEYNGAVFTPAYLFNEDGSRATRPRLGLVPNVVDYDEQFFVSVDDSINISKAHLIKLGSATHSTNQDQRLVPLAFNRDARRLTLQMPDSRNAAPPGHYLLFVVDSSGVPSEGVMIKLGQPVLAAEQTIKTTLEQNTWDTYLSEPIVGRASINLAAVTGVELYVSASKPVRSAEQSDVVCSATAQNNGRALCELDVVAGTQLHISVAGSARSDYTLMYTESEDLAVVTPVNSEQSSQNSDITNNVNGNTNQPDSTNNGTSPDSNLAAGSGQVRTGVGSTSHFWLLILMFSGLLRLFSYRIRVFN